MQAFNPWVERNEKGEARHSTNASLFENTVRTHGIAVFARAGGVAESTVARMLRKQGLFTRRVMRKLEQHKPFGLGAAAVWDHYGLQPPNPDDPCEFMEQEPHRRRLPV